VTVDVVGKSKFNLLNKEKKKISQKQVKGTCLEITDLVHVHLVSILGCKVHSGNFVGGFCSRNSAFGFLSLDN